MSKTLLTDVLDELKGADGAQLLGSQDLSIKIKGVIPTGCPSVDAAIGRGGIPRSRLTVLHGQEGSGKTTLALHIVASCQQMGGIVIYIDKEYKLDPEYAAALGVDLDKVIIIQPAYLERVFSISEQIVKKVKKHREESGVDAPILIVLDSMNAAIAKSQYEGEWDDKHYAPQARVFSELMPKLIPDVSKEDVALLFISQIRKKIGVMFGSDEEICGGWAPKVYASLIMGITKLSATKEDGEKVSNRIRVECFKNQIAPPFKKAECEIVYGKGIDKERSLLWIAEQKGIVKRKGAWYNYGKHRLGQGVAAAANNLKKHPGVYERLLNDLKELYKWEQ